MKVVQLCPTLCDPMDYAAHGTLQARILEWVAFPFSRGSSQPRNRTRVSRVAGGFFTNWAIREAQLHLLQLPPNLIFLSYNLKVKVLVTQSSPTLCEPMDCSPPGSSVHRILQATILEWVAIPFSRRSSQPRIESGSPALRADSLPSEPSGKPSYNLKVKVTVAQLCPTLCDPMDYTVHGIL